jgi:hypothetical protein
MYELGDRITHSARSARSPAQGGTDQWECPAF